MRHRWWILAFGLAYGLLALFVTNTYQQLIMTVVPVWAVMGLSWNLLSGYSGLISFGHAAFFGLGAYFVVIALVDWNLTPWISIPIAGVLGAVAGLVVGIPTFRLRGHYFALAMLAYPLALLYVFEWLGYQELAIPMKREAPVAFMQFADQRVYVFLALGLLLGAMVITRLVERSRFGRSLLAIKQDETAAEAAGIDTLRWKLKAITLSGAMAAAIGGFYAVVLLVVTPPAVFGMLVSAQALVVAMFGGVGTVWGPVIGAATLVPLADMLHAELAHIVPGIQGVIYGIAIIAVVLLAPEGIFWKVRDVLQRRRDRALLHGRPMSPAGAGVSAARAAMGGPAAAVIAGGSRAAEPEFPPPDRPTPEGAGALNHPAIEGRGMSRDDPSAELPPLPTGLPSAEAPSRPAGSPSADAPTAPNRSVSAEALVASAEHPSAEARNASADHRDAGQSDEARRRTPEPSAAPILEVRGLSKSFGGLRAVDDVNLTVRRGEILGIIGPNGAGKTTLFNLLNGFMPPDSGSVALNGEVITGKRANRICRLGVGRTFQVVKPFRRMSIADNVVVGAYVHASTDDAARALAAEAIETVGLSDEAASIAGNLTNKQLRLMEIARALASQPQIMLLDETLAGLSTHEVQEVIDVIKHLATVGITIVIIEHTMQAMVRLVDRFVVLDHGSVLAEGEPEAITKDPKVIEAYLGRKWLKNA